MTERTLPVHSCCLLLDLERSGHTPATIDPDLFVWTVVDSFNLGKRKQPGRRGPVHVDVQRDHVLVWCTFAADDVDSGDVDPADIRAQLLVGQHRLAGEAA